MGRVIDTFAEFARLLAKFVEAQHEAREKRVALDVLVSVREALDAVEHVVDRELTSLPTFEARVVAEVNPFFECKRVSDTIWLLLRHFFEQQRHKLIGPLEVVIGEQRVVHVHQNLRRRLVELLDRIQIFVRGASQPIEDRPRCRRIVDRGADRLLAHLITTAADGGERENGGGPHGWPCERSTTASGDFGCFHGSRSYVRSSSVKWHAA